MKNTIVYDIVGIGIGPFNLSLAALADQVPELNCKFIDQNPSFNWHPGLLMPNTRLQVPFFADLVTVADPTSRFSFLNFLKTKKRMFRFAMHENNFSSRLEYNKYCQWVASQLPSLNFGVRCESVEFSHVTNLYSVYATRQDGTSDMFHAKQIVIGIGTVPALPDCAKDMNHPMIFHSSEYLFKKETILKKKNIAIIGSGQSAAEIFYDLLQHVNSFENLNWFTRTEYLYPMDSSLFAYEMSSPDYISYYYSLDPSSKEQILHGQDRLYKGINADLIRDIQNSLYLNDMTGAGRIAKLYPNCELKSIKIEDENYPDTELFLGLHHTQKREIFSVDSETIILATGYKNMIPGFLDPVKELIRWTPDNLFDVQINYSIDRCNSIFVQNAELHTHGFNSADLGLGPYRNAVILNAILKRERFTLEKNTTFQRFDFPFN
jgi:lysine N6-hydroxylase